MGLAITLQTVAKRSARFLLRKAIAQGAETKEGDQTHFAVETSEDVLGLISAEVQGFSHSMDRLRALAQECDEVSFFAGQRTHINRLAHSIPPGNGLWSVAGACSIVIDHRKRCTKEDHNGFGVATLEVTGENAIAESAYRTAVGEGGEG